MPNSRTAPSSPAKEPTAREIRVERRFSSERQSRDMLKSLIRAHSQLA